MKNDYLLNRLRLKDYSRQVSTDPVSPEKESTWVKKDGTDYFFSYHTQQDITVRLQLT